jgi:hypothetical protein
MKIRYGFISNSSSSSFIILVDTKNINSVRNITQVLKFREKTIFAMQHFLGYNHELIKDTEQNILDLQKSIRDLRSVINFTQEHIKDDRMELLFKFAGNKYSNVENAIARAETDIKFYIKTIELFNTILLKLKKHKKDDVITVLTDSSNFGTINKEDYTIIYQEDN